VALGLAPDCKWKPYQEVQWHCRTANSCAWNLFDFSFPRMLITLAAATAFLSVKARKSLQEEGRNAVQKGFWHMLDCWLGWRWEPWGLSRPAIGTTSGAATSTSGRTFGTTIGTSAAITRGSLQCGPTSPVTGPGSMKYSLWPPSCGSKRRRRSGARPTRTRRPNSATSVTTSVTSIATNRAINAGANATVIGHFRGAAAGFQLPSRGIATATAARPIAEIDADLLVNAGERKPSAARRRNRLSVVDGPLSGALWTPRLAGAVFRSTRSITRNGKAALPGSSFKPSFLRRLRYGRLFPPGSATVRRSRQAGDRSGTDPRWQAQDGCRISSESGSIDDFAVGPNGELAAQALDRLPVRSTPMERSATASFIFGLRSRIVGWKGPHTLGTGCPGLRGSNNP